MTHIKIILIISLILVICSCSGSNRQSPTARDGVLDLRGVSSDELLSLNGDWTFRDLPANDSQLFPAGTLSVPGKWNQDTETTYKSGEYQLTIILPPDYPRQGMILIPELSQIVILEVNGEIVFESGDWVGDRTDFTRTLVPINLTEETHLTLRVKNVVFRTGGLHHVPLFGTYKRGQRYRISKLLLESINIGILFFIAFYYTFLFVRHYINRSAALLAVAAIAIMFRGFISGENMIIYLLPNFPWSWDYKVEYATIYFTTMVLLLFVYLSFPLKIKPIIISLKLYISIGILLLLISMFLPIKILSKTVLILQSYMLIMFFFQLFIIFSAIKKREKGSLLVFLGGTTFVILAIIDSLYYHGFNVPLNISQLGMLLFLLSQAFNQSRIYGDAYLRAEELTYTLEKEVTQRTKDIETVNQSLHEEILVRKQTENKLKKSVKEKEILLKEIHHRIKNNLAMITSLLHLQLPDLEDDRTREIFHQLENQIESIGIIHEKLYKSDDLSTINLKEYITDLITSILDSFSMKNVNVKIDIQDISFNLDVALPLGLILNELTINAIKHSFRKKGKNILEVKFYNALPAGQYMLSFYNYNDRQIRKIDNYNTESLGMKLVYLLTQQINGEINISFTDGFLVELNFPV
jgi:two-component sensor histidine kinase